MIAHGTDGSDGIEPGIHLRWAFRREMGFPLGCFRLYRRLSGEYGEPVCFDFQKLRRSEVRKPFNLGPGKKQMTFSSSCWPLALESRPTTGRMTRSRLERVLVIPKAELKVSLPELAYRVTVKAVFNAPGRITAIGYAGRVEVGRSTITKRSAGTRSVTVHASAIDTVKLHARSVGLVQVCYVPCESCEDHSAGNWELIEDSICLPICYTDDPCKEPFDKPECEWMNVEDRLPKDPCIRERYGGERAKELVSVLRTLVDSEGLTAQSDRMIEATALADGCPPPGQKQPTIGFRAIDAVLMAAIDPVVAKVLGLYYIDKDIEEGRAYDYKVVGNWPEGTLWQLSNCLTFEDSQTLWHRFTLNIIPLGELTLKATIRPTIIIRPSKSAGTNRALAFLKTDDLDWNFPDLDNLPFSPFDDPNNPAVEILFSQPVGEVQIHVGQRRASNLILEAWDDVRNRKVTNDVVSTRCEDVLVAHGDQHTDQITRIALKGREFWIYKICWDLERIPHGEHCAFVYGISLEDAEPLKPSSNVKAERLPGLVKKVEDCRPLLEGETSDARFNVGVLWALPLMNGQLLPKSPIRYHIRRISQDGEVVLLTNDTPILVTPPSNRFKQVRLQQFPEGWPEDPPFFIDSGLEPGTYRYQVQSIDLFGRRSRFSNASNTISPFPAPPSPPTNVNAYFIDAKDPWLSAEDRTALSNGVDALAIRLTWDWPEIYDRMSPDVQSFKVHYIPGIPNVLLGVVEFVDGGTDAYVDIKVEVEGLGSTPENLLVGRFLYQDGKAFRILTHREGIAHGTKQTLVCRLRLPPSPSTNRPAVGQCSIALDTSIPVEMSQLTASGDAISAVIKTTAIEAIPHSGLETSRLEIAQIEAVITAIDRHTLTGDYFELEAQLTIADPDRKDQFLNIPVPFHAKLRLPQPSPDIYKDYSDPASWPAEWPRDGSIIIPKNIQGQYDLIIRKTSTHETSGLISSEPGKYTLLVDQLPLGLDTNLNTPIRNGHFGVSCIGEGGEGPVSVPAGFVRVYRGDETERRAVLVDLKRPIAPQEDIVIGGPPNFEGKLEFDFSQHNLSWTKRSDWRYEVYRTLDDTLFRVDDAIRCDIATGKSSPRFSNATEKQQWLYNNFPSGNHSEIEQLIIDPASLDLATIESHTNRNILLQALASLPYNERAFTKLDLDVEHLKQDENDASKMTCIDDTIEGRAKGRYFYRVQAFDTAGNPSSMGISTPPIYVRGDLHPRAPVITRVEGGDRQITIRWATIRDPNIKGYLVYRTDDKARTKDLRRMEIIKTNPTEDYSVAVLDHLPIEFEYIDATVEPRKKYFYGIVAISEGENQEQLRSKISTIRVGQAYDLTPPDPPTWTRTEWTRVDPDGNEFPFVDPVPSGETRKPALALAWTSTDPNLKPLIQKRRDDEARFSRESDWLPRGSTEYILRGLHPHIRYHFRLLVLSLAGNRNQDFNIATVEPIVSI